MLLFVSHTISVTNMRGSMLIHAFSQHIQLICLSLCEKLSDESMYQNCAVSLPFIGSWSYRTFGSTFRYLSLRLDGRVRGSGVGYPPWNAFVAQLPPVKGLWSGLFDGFDGRVL